MKAKAEIVASECEKLRSHIEVEQERGVKREREVMESLKGTVGEIKGEVVSEKASRE